MKSEVLVTLKISSLMFFLTEYREQPNKFNKKGVF